MMGDGKDRQNVKSMTAAVINNYSAVSSDHGQSPDYDER
jgi:hypothetical protein